MDDFLLKHRHCNLAGILHPRDCWRKRQRGQGNTRFGSLQPVQPSCAVLAGSVPSGSYMVPQGLQHHTSTVLENHRSAGPHAAQPSASPGTLHEKINTFKLKSTAATAQAQPQEYPRWPEESPMPSSMWWDQMQLAVPERTSIEPVEVSELKAKEGKEWKTDLQRFNVWWEQVHVRWGITCESLRPTL